MKCSLSGGFVFATPNSLLEQLGAVEQTARRKKQCKPFWLKAHLPELALANVKKCKYIFLKLLQTQALLSTLRMLFQRDGGAGSHTAGAVPSLPQEHARKTISQQKFQGSVIQGNPVLSGIPVALSGLFLMRHNSSPSATSLLTEKGPESLPVLISLSQKPGSPSSRRREENSAPSSGLFRVMAVG